MNLTTPRFYCFFLLVFAGRFASAQVNNECSGALSLAFGLPLTSGNIGATQSQPPLQCNGFVTPGQAKDVWFKFTYAAGMDSLVADPGPNPDADIAAELFSGNCGALQQISCSNFAEQLSNNQSEGFLLSSLGLLEGVTYYCRVYGSGGIETAFKVLLKSANGLPPPLNDECSAAQLLNAGQTIPGNSIGATQSLAAAACNNFTSTAAKDVWFKFTKTPPMESLILFPDGSDLVLQIFSGTCSSLNAIACSDNEGLGETEQVSLSSLALGSVFYARVYGRNGTAGSFAIKLASPPLNDNCATAAELLPNAGLNGKTVDATQSAPPSACGGTSDDDVWYYFIKAANMDSVVITPGPFFNPVIELRSSPCSTSMAISCQHTGGRVKLPVATLQNNQRYFIRVYSHSGSPGTFSIKLFQGTGSAPANDQCENAQPVNPAIGVAVSGSNAGATQSFGAAPCGGSGSTSSADVWYSFVRTAVRDSLKIDASGVLDLLADVRSACSPDSLIACLDEEGNLEKTMDLSELTIGKTYYLRIFARNGAAGDFTFRFTENTLVPQPPVNNDCFSAAQLTVSASCAVVAGTTISADATSGLALPCGATGAGKDVWYKFSGTTKAIVRLTCEPGFDGVLQVLKGNCFSPISEGCVNDFQAGSDPDFPVVEELFLPSLTSSTTYFIRILGNNGSTGNFSVCVYNPNCNSTAATLSLGSSSIVSNQAFTAALGGAQGVVSYQISSGGGNFKTFAASTYNATDTLVYSSSVSGVYSIRASSRLGECFPAGSNAVNLTVRCATPFSEQGSDLFIKQVKISNLDNSSGKNLLGGSVQDFNTQSAVVCKGATYVLYLMSSKPLARMRVWGDFNQNGSFSDPGENLMSTLVADTGLIGYPVIIPAAASTGNCRLRIMLVGDTSEIGGTNPCFAGSYISGEIEEYNLSISSGTVATAGTDQNSGCSASATLSGNNPGAGNSGIWLLVSGMGEIANPGSANTIVNNLGPGPNIFRWSLTNSCGTSSDDVVISSGRAVAKAGNDFTSCDATAFLNALNPSPGNGQWTVLSGSSVPVQPGLYNSVLNNLSVGINRLRWFVSSPGCPSASDTIIITRQANPVSLGNDTAICAPFSLTLNGPSGAGSYLWSNGGTGANLAINEFGQYWLQVTTAEGCVFRDSISINNCTATNQKTAASLFGIYPNPSNGFITISGNGEHRGHFQIECLSPDGKIMYKEVILMEQNTVDVKPDLAPSLYILRIRENGKSIAHFKLLRQ